VRTIFREGTVVKLVDQTQLPHEVRVIECSTTAALCEAIQRMQIRGAPALGVAAAYAMALGSEAAPGEPDRFLAYLDQVAGEIRSTRPTAVNLFHGVDASRATALAAIAGGAAAARLALWSMADEMAEDDIATNRRIGAHGAALVPPGSRVLTHCNAGALATVGWGTALGVVRSAHLAEKGIHVLATETRPFLQGARLTMWELSQEGIPCTLITDSMAGHLMARGEVDLCVVGADRIAAAGDVANKIGTYTLAVLAHAHRLPFYVAAPLSTFDLSVETGGEIPIEERDPNEVLSLGGVRTAPEGVSARHPAFDVTPSRYVTAIITEVGVLRSPYERTIPEAVQRGRAASSAGAEFGEVRSA
jgi:methylthioribose-1-phosphate isomerase